MTEDWIVIPVVAPEVIWSRYADAIGLEELQRTFGAHWPPPRLRVNEEVYAWRDRNLSPRPFDPTDHPAAWLSLSINQFNPARAHMSRGVWPGQHGKGLGRLMRDFAEQWCRLHVVPSLSIEVYLENLQHLVNVQRDPYWTMDGVLFDPWAFTFTHAIIQATP